MTLLAITQMEAYAERKLDSTEDASTGSDHYVGDFAYYSPWGNIAMYYKDSGYADGVIKYVNIVK